MEMKGLTQPQEEPVEVSRSLGFVSASSTSLPFSFPEQKPKADDLSSIDSFILRAEQDYRKPWYILLPDSVGRRAWEALVVIVMVYVATVLPYRVAFNVFGPQWLPVDIIIDIIFFIDIIVNFFTAYRKWNGKVTVNHKKIVIRYLRTWFIVDVIATIPFYLILPDPNNINRLTHLLRFARFIGIIKFVRLINISIEKPNFFQRSQGYLSIRSLLSKLIWFFFWSFLSVHIACCIWIYIGNSAKDLNEPNWLTDYFGPALPEISEGSIYLTSMYWSVTLFATVGLGDVVARNDPERGFSVLVMVLGVGFYSYMISAVSRIVANLDNERSQLHKRFDALETLLAKHTLPKELVGKLRKYLFKRLDRTEPTDLIRDLPSKLRNEVLLEIHAEILSKIPFLADKSHSFTAEVLAQLRIVYFEGGVTIAEKNDYSSEVYFLTSGQVEMFDPDHPEEIHLVEAGNFFGEGCLFGGKHPFSYRAKEQVQCYFITKKCLKPIVDNHPDMLLLLKMKYRLREIRHHIHPDILRSSISTPSLLRTHQDTKPRASTAPVSDNRELLVAIQHQLEALQQSNAELKKMVLELQQQKKE